MNKQDSLVDDESKIRDSSANKENFNFSNKKQRPPKNNPNQNFLEALDIKSYKKKTQAFTKMNSFMGGQTEANNEKADKILSRPDHKKLQLSEVKSLKGESEQKEKSKINFFERSNHQKFGKISQEIFLSKFSQNSNFIEIKNYEFMHTQKVVNSTLQMIIAIMSILNVYIEFEINHHDFVEEYYNVQDQPTKFDDLISKPLFYYDHDYKPEGLFSLWFSFFISMLLLATITFDYYLDAKMSEQTINHKLIMKEPKRVALFSFKFLVFLSHPNPVFCHIFFSYHNDKYNTNTIYSLNSLMSIICLLRVWFLIQYYLTHNIFSAPRTKRMAEMSSVNVDIMFSLKASIIKYPYRVYFLLFITCLIFSIFSLRVFEMELDSITSYNFKNYWNSSWCLIITILTVGYGDFVPSTSYGRIIGIITTMYGVFLLSMLIISVTNFLVLENNEKNIYLLIERIYMKNSEEKAAAKLISSFLALHYKMKRDKVDKSEVGPYSDRILLNLNNFLKAKKEIDDTFPPYSSKDLILENLEYLELEIEAITEKFVMDMK